MEETRLFNWGGTRLAFDRMGEGPTTLILLHGYGEDKSSFHPLMQALSAQFTCLAPDLPFHGETVWNESDPCTPKRFSELIQAWLHAEQVSTQPLAILGYSMGGRIALSLLQEGQLSFTQAWLLASDGLYTHPLYWMATQTNWGNLWFKQVMRQPRLFLNGIRMLNQLGWLNSTRASLTHRYLENESARKALYKRWTGLRTFRMQPDRLRTQIEKQNLRIQLIYGKKDRLIVASPGQKWANQMPAHMQLHWMEGGHRLLHASHVAALRSIILR